MTFTNMAAVLIGATNHWFSSLIHFSIRDFGTLECQIHFFLTHMATETSIWFEILFSFIRVVAVTWPHQVKNIFSIRNTKIWLLIITILVAIKNIGQSWAQGVVQFEWGRKCLFPHPLLGYIFSLVEFISIVIIPYILFIGTSLIVGYQIAVATKTRIKLAQGEICSSNIALKSALAEEAKHGTIKLLFFSNYAFVFLYGPYMIYRICEAYLDLFKTKDPAEALFIDMVYRLVNLFLYFFHSIYWVFLFAGRKYRRVFFAYFKHVCTAGTLAENARINST